MILAINVNAAIDWIYFIDRFTPGSTMRVKKAVLGVGGKGLDAALVLHTLGAPHKALSFAAGHNGKLLADLLAKRGVDCEFIWVEGETRVSNVLVETEFNRHSHVITPGYQVTAADCETFIEKMQALSSGAQWALMGGSLPQGAPPDFYFQIISRLKALGVKTLIDNTEVPMLAALNARPDIAKMNQSEFQTTFDIQIQHPSDLPAACRRVMAQYQLTALVVTRGKEGLLACTPDGVFEAVCTQPIKEVNAAGAGDAVSGTLAYRLSLGDTWPQALSWAVAVSAAVVKTEGTAECYLTDVLDLYPHA
ncbi:MAG: hexose kinase, partial [Anaerolineae bacterium]|nr:hexose kinase [Anaerolineae bacterium]